MRCSTIRSTDIENTCTGIATHLLLGSIRDGETGKREHFRDPVCKPCAEAYQRRHALKARAVPLHVHEPLPEFISMAGKHRLVEYSEHTAQCHDCGSVSSPSVFEVAMLHGCQARPESVDFLQLTRDHVYPERDHVSHDANGRAEASARMWFDHAANGLGMVIEDWRPVQNDPETCATFTFRDREYRLKFDLAGYRIAAEKLENRGRPAPVTINPEIRENYKQVVFRFHGMVNKYESTYFATYTPGREDVILHAPEGQITAVLRLTGLTRPGDPLAEVTDAVCDAFGPIADLVFHNWIYE